MLRPVGILNDAPNKGMDRSRRAGCRNVNRPRPKKNVAQHNNSLDGLL